MEGKAWQVDGDPTETVNNSKGVACSRSSVQATQELGSAGAAEGTTLPNRGTV